jgi:predicted nucleic acid-binding protein
MAVVRIVVDANIAFRAIAGGRGDLRTSLAAPTENRFFAPFFVLVELFKHKERIHKSAKIPDDEILTALHSLCECLTFVREASIPVGVWTEAYRLVKEIDPKDTPYVALALHLRAKLWTLDEVLKSGLRLNGFDDFWEP